MANMFCIFSYNSENGIFSSIINCFNVVNENVIGERTGIGVRRLGRDNVRGIMPLREMVGSHRSVPIACTPEGSVPKMRNAVSFFAKEHRVWLVVV